MAKYDGSIRINTQIETKNASAQLMSLENRIVKAADKMAALRSKMDALKNTKIPTDEYKEISKQIEKAESEFNKLLEKQEKMQQEGKDNGAAWDKLNDKIDEVGNTINFAQGELQDLVDTGKAFTLGSDTEEYKKIEQQLKYLENDYDVLIQRKKEFEEKHNVKSSSDGYEKLKNSLNDFKSLFTTAISPIKKFKDAFTFHNVDQSGYERLGNALNELKDTAGRAADSIKKSFANLRENPLSAIAGGSLNLGNQIWNGMTAGMEAAIGKLQSGVSRIKEILQNMWDSAGNAVDAMVRTVGEKLAGFSASIINSMLHPIQTIKNVTKTSADGISNALKSGLSSALDGLKEKAAGAAASIINGIIHPIQTFRNTAPVAINTVSGLFQRMQSSINGITGLLSKTVSGLKTIGGSIAGAFKKATSVVGSLAGKIKELAQKHMPRLRKETEKTKSSFSTFGKRIKELLLSALIFNRISSALNAMVNGAKEGLNNLVMYSDKVNGSMSMLMSSLTRLKNSLATAFAPILNVIAPILSRFIDMLSEAATRVGMFFAALTGQTSFEKAVAVQEDYRKSLEGTAKAKKKENKEQDKYLSGLDEIRRWESNKDEDEEDELTPEDMFTTVPVENSMVDLANKVKDIFDQIFAPLKEAWNREGKFVMDSWKYALGEIWKLAKDIGRDFLKVWNQEATIAMLADMLHIIGDIGLVVGTLAEKFREAWNANDVGLHILENIRDIFAVVVHNIREAADYTVEWAKTLDFTPLLQGVERLTASLVPFFDFVSGTLADFYTQFILPLTSWTLSEAGLPRLLNILASFMEMIDWQALRSAFKELYSALEPYAEAIGTGLLDFIEKMKDEGVEFFNFLPGAIQRAADALRNGDLPAAFYEFGSIAGEAVKYAFNTIRTAIESIPWGEIGTWIASFLNGIDWDGVLNALFGSFTSAINGAIDLAYNFIMTTDWWSLGVALGTNLQNAWNAIDWQQAGETVGAGLKSILDFLLATVQQLDWAQIGRDIGTFLSAIPWGDILGNVFSILGTVFGGLLEGLKQSLPGRILTTIVEMIASLKLASFLMSTLTPILTTIFGPAGTIAGLIISGLAALAPVLFNLGGDIINGLLNGIGNVVKSIGQWISDHIFKPFIDAFKSVFGIHSPSTVMEEQGKFIMQGLLNGINSLVNKVVSIFSDIKDKVVKKWEEIKTDTKRTWENVGTTIKTSWENIKTNVATKVDAVKTSVSKGWENVKTNSKTTWDTIKTNLSGTWENLKSTAHTRFDNIKSSVIDAWSRTQSSSNNVWGGIKNDLLGTWENLRGSAVNAFGMISSAVQNAWDGLKESTRRAWDGLVNIIKSPVNAVIGVLNSLIRGVATMVNNIAEMLNSLKIDIPDWVPGIGGGTLGFNIPTWTPGQIPYLATGAVIPPNKEFMAVLGDQKHGNNIEAPEALIRNIIREELRRNQPNNNGGSYQFTANLNRRVIFDEIIEEAKLRQTSSGRNPFEMA